MRATQWRTRDIGVVRVRLEERENITVTAENHLRRLRAVAIDHLREEQSGAANVTYTYYHHINPMVKNYDPKWTTYQDGPPNYQTIKLNCFYKRKELNCFN